MENLSGHAPEILILPIAKIFNSTPTIFAVLLCASKTNK